jgi:hypothetical protein
MKNFLKRTGIFLIHITWIFIFIPAFVLDSFIVLFFNSDFVMDAVSETRYYKWTLKLSKDWRKL